MATVFTNFCDMQISANIFGNISFSSNCPSWCPFSPRVDVSRVSLLSSSLHYTAAPSDPPSGSMCPPVSTPLLISHTPPPRSRCITTQHFFHSTSLHLPDPACILPASSVIQLFPLFSPSSPPNIFPIAPRNQIQAKWSAASQTPILPRKHVWKHNDAC